MVKIGHQMIHQMTSVHVARIDDQLPTQDVDL